MEKLLLALFPEGKRKLVITIVALAIGAGFEKFGGGLTDQMVTALLGVVAIFTSGNMVEHIVSIFKGASKKEEDQDADMAYTISSPVPSRSATEYLGHEIETLKAALNGLSKQMEVQSQNTAAIVNVINTMRAGQNAQAAANQPRGNKASAGGNEL